MLPVVRPASPRRGSRRKKGVRVQTLLIVFLIAVTVGGVVVYTTRWTEKPIAVVHETQAPLAITNELPRNSSDSAASSAGPPYFFPKLIHQTAKDKKHLSCEEIENIKSWKHLNPSYSYKLYDDDDIRSFMESYYPQLLPLFNNFLHNVERADMWRYLVLHKFGGVYADLDVRCMQPIDKWNREHGHDAQVLIGVEMVTEGKVSLNQWTMAAVPGHPLFASLPDAILNAIQNEYFHLLRDSSTVHVKEEYNKNIIQRTGPIMWTQAVVDYLGNHTRLEPDIVDKGLKSGSVRILPTRSLSVGWEIRESGGSTTCEDLAKGDPKVLVCHQFHGTWKDVYYFKPQVSYDCPQLFQ